ncbi:YcnI family protein [Janibacter sp. CX7]|uniref:YcnI family copper-binding membrane protein n=1 Tax=Janibacter sp. CX7 TaxID=2963431 RepID=UPI0020CEDEE1|nr:YcnI family protein [Janibacter sp. CX7]UTT66533.1 YcnI family protein [Janibacter sp. CX7]
MNRTILRSGAALTLALAATAATALPASAHVRVIPDATASGGYAALTFRVPNESDTASTTKLVVTLPQDRPLATVSVRPVPGWTAKVTTAKLPEKVTANDLVLSEAPRTVTWTADSDAAGIAPGEYAEFAISAGPLPTPGELVLPAKQTYSDGEVADWSDVATEGGEEPESPAPSFEVTAAEEGGHHATTDDEGSKDARKDAGSEPAASDTLARTLGGLALVVALAGAGVAVAGRRRA